MNIGVPAETESGERRVALSPDAVKSLKEKGFEIVVQAGAGEASGFSDDDYRAAGASVDGDILGTADIVLKVQPPSDAEAARIKPGATLISFLYPSARLGTIAKLAERNVDAYAMELIPRITRAQSMDALSSMSTIAGYKGALLAASHSGKFFPMFMTAAGTMPASKVFIIGAGVAGLQAIATCKRLGAIVEAFDVRPAVKEQVESLGAKFVAMQIVSDDAQDASGYAKEVSADTHTKELELIASRMSKNDVVITTALIPGKPAPVLITKDMVGLMPRGSVIVDLAAPAGGNCEATVPGETVVVSGVTIVGITSLLSDMATDASRMYAKNITAFLLNLAPKGELNMDMEDEIIRTTLVSHAGAIHHEPTRLQFEKGGSQ